MFHIKEAAELSGVSIKTLHHYDKIGLLVPVKSENGYRTYSQDDLERLQVILYYKYLGFSLDQIAELLAEEKSNLLPHLTKQLDYLTQERKRLDTLISTLQKTIQEQKGERQMTIEEKFTGFSYQDTQKYQQEAVDKYGQEVMNQALERQKGREDEATRAFNQVFQVFAKNLQAGLPVTEFENQEEAALELSKSTQYEAYLSEMADRADLMKRKLKLEGKKDESSLMLMRENVLKGHATRMKHSYETISRLFSIKNQELQELKLMGLTS